MTSTRETARQFIGELPYAVGTINEKRGGIVCLLDGVSTADIPCTIAAGTENKLTQWGFQMRLNAVTATLLISRKGIDGEKGL